MKKYINSILSLILALAMVFALVACGGGDDSSNNDDDEESSKSSSSQSSSDENEGGSSQTDKSIVGEWEGTYIFLPGTEGEMILDVTYMFDEKGHYSLKFDAEKFVDETIEELQEYYEGREEDFDEFLKKEGCDTLEEFREKGINTIKEKEYDGIYEFYGDSIKIDKRTMDVEYDGNNLSFGHELFSIDIKRA